MGQGSLKRRQKKLDGYALKKEKLERDKKIKRAEKLAKKGVVITRPKNSEERTQKYKQVSTAHKATKRGSAPAKREKAHMFTAAQRAQYAKLLGVHDRRAVQRVRAQLIAEQGMRCAICGLPITREEDCTVDHIVPRSKGGKTTMSNCQLAHKLCNLLKDNQVSEKKLDN